MQKRLLSSFKHYWTRPRTTGLFYYTLLKHILKMSSTIFRSAKGIRLAAYFIRTLSPVYIECVARSVIPSSRSLTTLTSCTCCEADTSVLHRSCCPGTEGCTSTVTYRLSKLGFIFLCSEPEKEDKDSLVHLKVHLRSYVLVLTSSCLTHVKLSLSELLQMVTL